MAKDCKIEATLRILAHDNEGIRVAAIYDSSSLHFSFYETENKERGGGNEVADPLKEDDF